MHENGIAEIPQYSSNKILLVWTAAAAPMAAPGWIVTPAVVNDPRNPGVGRLAMLAIGLVWQFVLVVILLHRETGNLRWSTTRHRLWLHTPRLPRATEPRPGLWWLLVPLIVLTGLFDLQIRGTLNKLWVSIFPFLAQPPGFDFGGDDVYALPSRYFHSSWFGIFAHSGQSVFLAILVLGLVLGWA